MLWPALLWDALRRSGVPMLRSNVALWRPGGQGISQLPGKSVRYAGWKQGGMIYARE